MSIHCEIPTKRTVVSFLRDGFTSRLNGIDGKFVTTYSDEDCTEQECKPARRSFNDLYDIVKVRYPKYDKNKLAYRLLWMIQKGHLSAIYCPAIKKIVFFNKRAHYNFIGTDNISKKPLNYKGVDGISAKNLIDMANKFRKIC